MTPISFNQDDTLRIVPTIASDTLLTDVEHILASGVGVLDFAVAGESGYYTWWGTEDADWTIEDIDRVENADEDRIIVYPAGRSFTCEIDAESEEMNNGARALLL